MGVRKITVSLPPELAASLSADAAERGETTSAWVTDAVARKLRKRHARELLLEYEAARGPITAKERAEARKRWPG